MTHDLKYMVTCPNIAQQRLCSLINCKLEVCEVAHTGILLTPLPSITPDLRLPSLVCTRLACLAHFACHLFPNSLSPFPSSRPPWPDLRRHSLPPALYRQLTSSSPFLDRRSLFSRSIQGFLCGENEHRQGSRRCPVCTVCWSSENDFRRRLHFL